MTCIVGLVKDKSVFIGADSGATGVNVLRTTLVPKVFAVGPYLIGYTASFRIGQLLQYHFKPQESSFHSGGMEHMVTQFIPTLRKMLKEHGCIRGNDGCETLDGEFMIGYQGGLYHIFSDFHVNRYVDTFDACGSGEEYVLGAMHNNPLYGNGFPIERIYDALRATAYFTPSVSPPFHIMHLSSGVACDVRPDFSNIPRPMPLSVFTYNGLPLEALLLEYKMHTPGKETIVILEKLSPFKAADYGSTAEFVNVVAEYYAAYLGDKEAIFNVEEELCRIYN